MRKFKGEIQVREEDEARAAANASNSSAAMEVGYTSGCTS